MKTNTVGLSEKCYIKQETEKKFIVIHGSNTRTQYSPEGGRKGTAQDVIDQWNKNKEKFACSYLIDRDGTIIEAFDDKYWSNHLNIENSRCLWDKASIGIMLVNEGPLVLNNKFFFINNSIHHQNAYTGPRFNCSFRNYSYYADLSKVQVTSLVDLIKWLSAKHDIFPVYHDNFDFNKRIWDVASIFTHSVVNEKVNDLPLNTWVRALMNKEFSKI